MMTRDHEPHDTEHGKVQFVMKFSYFSWLSFKWVYHLTCEVAGVNGVKVSNGNNLLFFSETMENEERWRLLGES